MLVIFKHGQRCGFLSRTQEANPILFVRQSCVSDYEPVVLTFAQCVAILSNLNDMHRVLVLADAATGLRISEILALRWSDVDWKNSCIQVTRAYVYGRFGPPKSRASKRPVPLHPLLAASLETWRGQTSMPPTRILSFLPEIEGQEAAPGKHARGKSPSACGPEGGNHGAGRVHSSDAP